ncbi:hypothetical protein VNO77_27810 [Canavalia gladiata]|uniref:Uncharacterized protein n=1 Tax=Canavalia gladiata TaxID=3824 RepID=A0AAN9KZJ7_CANGL
MIPASMLGNSSVKIQLSLERFDSSMPIAWLSLTFMGVGSLSLARAYSVHTVWQPCLRHMNYFYLKEEEDSQLGWGRIQAELDAEPVGATKLLTCPIWFFYVVVRSFVVFFFKLSLRGDSCCQGELPLKRWMLLLKIKQAKRLFESLKEMWP